MSLSCVTRLLNKIKALIGGNKSNEIDLPTTKSSEKTCDWCGEENPDEHKDLKLVISELTHNWGLERNVMVKRISELRKQNEYLTTELTKADRKLYEQQ